MNKRKVLNNISRIVKKITDPVKPKNILLAIPMSGRIKIKFNTRRQWPSLKWK